MDEHLKDPVLGEQLRRAREAIMLSTSEVAEHLNISSEHIKNLESNETRPKLDELDALARLYKREIGYFVRNVPPLPVNRIRYRSLGNDWTISHISLDSRFLIVKFDELCRTAHELETLLGKERHVELSDYSTGVQSKEAAKIERDALGLDSRTPLKEKLEHRGIRIFELPIETSEFAGFSYWHDIYGPSVLINARDLPGRKAFTLAHEYAHLIFRDDPSACNISPEYPGHLIAAEKRANLFAANFLMPEEGVRKEFSRRNFSNQLTIKDIGLLAGKWNVSVQAMGYRLENLELIPKGYTTEILSSYQEPTFRRRRKGAAPSWQKRLGKPYVKTAIEAYKDRCISLGKLAQSLGLPIRRALEVAEHGIK
jgi:Zn-dependent peptidase ImmA (M78 family)/transcriptional regulator with XRE-family HTH domain